MIELNRRILLAGAAAAATLPATGIPARAAAPLAGSQNPGFYRYKVGTYELTVLLDGFRRTRLTASPSPNTPLETIQAELEKNFLPKDEIFSYFHPTLINTGKKLILIDTGNGPGSTGAGTGRIPANLAASGYKPEQVDTVIISHFHGDHISGLRSGDGSLAFPNAEILVPEAEWAYWVDDGNMSRATAPNVQNTHKNVRRIFAGLGERLKKYDGNGGKEIAPGVIPVDTSGHTPGHASFIIASGKDKVCYQADVTSGFAPLFVANPGWHPGGDMDPVKGEETRRRFYDMLATERMLVSGYHFTFPSLAYLEKSAGGYRLVPAPWNPSL